ncbi:hypothetical protein PHLCEN_2v9520 [Hermanssonia centrifuga]|uniref:Tubulin-folding cofactor D C-terminal domain-containing protein n=1 Tax=Hermanssonia centrifuga TaxID=98765 RepID=A0A2R6NQF7_9APHY|nr:hypothetical protein PHLCEN_2v9520 [Hermanssonia centrifuga]
MLAGLEDYTTDERGDVGSWIRIVCVKGLASFAEILITDAAAMPHFAEYLPASRYHDAVAGILKQGVERLDNVRQQAGEQLLRLLVLPSPAVPQSEAWLIEGDHLMKELFLRRVLAVDLLTQAKRNLASNNVVIPVLQTFNVLLEGDAFEDLGDDPGGLKSTRISKGELHSIHEDLPPGFRE